MNSNYIKYKNWARRSLLISCLLIFLTLITGLMVNQTKWAKAILVNYGKTNAICFTQKTDYQQWVEKHHEYVECVHDNELFRLKIDQKTTKQYKESVNNAIFVLLNRSQLKKLSTKDGISVYTNRTPWLFYFIKNLI